MTLRLLVVVALRFYAIYFAVTLLAILPTFISLGGMVPEFRPSEVVSLIGYLLLALVLWFTANRLAKSVVREFDSSVQLQLSFENAFAFAFVFLGLYFFLTSIGGTVTQLVRVVSASSQYEPGISRDTMEQRAVVDFCRPAITCIFGLASLCGSRAWSRKLTAPRG
jgi:hypothetical protein